MEQAVLQMSPAAQRDALIDCLKAIPATYRTWFQWEERLKNFRSIRRGIEGGGSRQRLWGLDAGDHRAVDRRAATDFKGADHPFLWKPKLRIPDICENEDNPRAFEATAARVRLL